MSFDFTICRDRGWLYFYRGRKNVDSRPRYLVMEGRTCFAKEIVCFTTDHDAFLRAIVNAEVDGIDFHHTIDKTQHHVFGGFSDDSIVEFFDAVRRNRNVWRLDLSGDGGYSLPTWHLAQIFSNTALRDVDLSFNDINCDGVSMLCDALANNTTLQRLNLNSNFIGSRGLSVLGKFLQRSGVKDLSIKYNRFTPADALMLHESIQTDNYSFENVEVSDRVEVQIGRPGGHYYRRFQHGLAFYYAQQQLDTMCQRNVELAWRNVHKLIFGIVCSLSPFDLPIYVLLWIIDWLPHLERSHQEVKKVRLIESVVTSIRKVKSAAQLNHRRLRSHRSSK